MNPDVEDTVGFRERLKRFTLAVARGVTRVLLFVGLVLVYLLGVGPTALVTAVFSRRRWRARRGASGGYWQPAVGYTADLDDATRQS